MEPLEDKLVLLPCPSIVVVAVNKSKNSRFAVKWALQNFIQEQRLLFKLLHVRPRITTFPTPLGNYPISHIRDDIAAAYKEEVERKTDKMLLPYKQYCTNEKVEADILVIEADNVADTISSEVSKLKANKLVIGASSDSMFKWKLKSKDLSSKISECTPSFCTVYVINRGKLSSVRSSKSETDGGIRAISYDGNSCSISSSSSNVSSHLDGTDEGSSVSYSQCNYPSLVLQRFEALSTINQGLRRSRSASNIICQSGSECSGGWNSSFRGVPMDLHSCVSSQVSTAEVPTLPSSESTVDIGHDVEKLRIELRHARGMYAVAQNETISASRQLNNLAKHRAEEALKFEEINLREEQVRGSAREEKKKNEAVKREVELLRDWAEREASERKKAEYRATRDANEKHKLEKVLESPFEPYKIFTWNEIVSATSSFSDDLRIGMGAYGTVYKCTLNHVPAAVKVLHSRKSQSTKEFQQELYVLSKIRHPHLLLLLGACPDHSCLVYEYMENGSLEERLLQNNDTLPIPWFKRYRIAWEIASALVFLHNTKPRSIVHRDLKPANILLDQNLVSKIGDVGVSTLLPSIDCSQSSMYKDTGLAGTLCYIDPEYQRSGLVSPKSDVYAFGMVILQILTAKPALALTHMVETALEKGHLSKILDPRAGNWPVVETNELAVLGLRCLEIKQSDRPDLNAEVLPVLERLKEIADKAADSAPIVQPAPPNEFICPLLKEVMEDPCVAADGYTYDRKAIEFWLKKNDESPITSLPLPNKNLISNYSLLSAIMKWKFKQQ